MTNNKPGSKPLKNPKRELFCHEFMVDMNRTKAAERALYSVKTAKMQGSRLMTKDDIQERIAYLCEQNIEKHPGLTIERILEELECIATVSIKDVISAGEKDLVVFKSIDDIPDDVARAIKSVKYKTDGKKGSIEFTFYNKEKALELAGKYHGMYIEKIAHSGQTTVTHEFSEEFAPKSVKDKKGQEEK